MLRFRTSLALIGLGACALLAQGPAALAQSTGSEPAVPGTAPAAQSGKGKPEGATTPKAARKARKAKAQATEAAAAAADQPVPSGTAAAEASKPAATSGKPTGSGAPPSKVAEAKAEAEAPPKTPGAAPTTGPAPATTPTAGPKPGITAPATAAKTTGPKCSLEDPEQPRGGRLDVIGSNFGPSPLVRVAGKPVRMIERREDRISVQVPADSDGGPVAVQAQGVVQPCGTLVIIGKNR